MTSMTTLMMHKIAIMNKTEQEVSLQLSTPRYFERMFVTQ